MSAKTDLDNAFSILDAGISAHVGALKSARDTAAAAQAVANDDSYLQSLTAKVLAFSDTLSSSANPPVVLTPAVQVAAQVAQVLPPVVAAPLPTFLVPPTAPAVLAPVGSASPVSPASVLLDPGATPAMIAAAQAALAAQAAPTAPAVLAAAAPAAAPVLAPVAAPVAPVGTIASMEAAVRSLLGSTPK